MMGINGLVRARIWWLAIFFIGLMLAAVVVEYFEEVLSTHVAIGYFVPLIIGHAGNSGSQSVSSVIRAIALEEITYADFWTVVMNEAVSGMIMGCIPGLSVLLISLAWPAVTDMEGMAVALSLPLVSLWANSLGAALPLLATRFKLSAVNTAAPLMTTLVDATGLMLYFAVAATVLDIAKR